MRTDLDLPPSFPADEYTPHGYIDNPYHLMVLNRSGLMRSVPPLGFGYWRRGFKGSYGSGARDHVNYLSLLQVGVACEEARFLTTRDFADRGIQLVSRYHSKHMMSYDWEYAGLGYSLRYFLPREHTLACRIELANSGGADRDVFLHASHIYGLWEHPWWGSNGVGMHYVQDADAAVSAIWAYGDYFALGSDRSSIACKATGSAEQWQRWLRENDHSSAPSGSVRGPGPLHTVLSYRLTVPAGERAAALVCLSRGVNPADALQELKTGLAEAVPTLVQQLADDEVFWSHCPQLEGDWPAEWKRGWVYDWETLRMNVRPPAGIFNHHWDAMQIHSPRSVLGEASLDMLALSLADPELAKEVLLGTFADAPAPNVPCCREDGSMNMIAADGQACGTAPSWCFPFHVIRSIYAATGDQAWIARLYPHLKVHLEWWLENRTDAHGWFHCHCDWESGQDGSRRFPEAEGGIADSVRTVDVEASMAEAFRNMALFAHLAGCPQDVPRWTELAESRTEATREMFIDGWYRDFDARTSQPVRLDYADVMMLTPLTCGVATPQQVEAIRPALQHFRDQPHPWLEWPSFFLAYSEAAWVAGLDRLSAEATADVADRIYPRIDQRGLRFENPAQPYVGYRVPGVACEFWPVSEKVEPGGEGYGWGATLPLYIIRNIVGFRESDDPARTKFFLAPALPERLLTTGRSYLVRNLHYRGTSLCVCYEVLGPDRLLVRLDYSSPAPAAMTVCDRSGQTIAGQTNKQEQGTCSFECVNGQVLLVRLAS